MQQLKRSRVLSADTAGRDDQKIAVARGVATTEHKRAGQINADKRRVQNYPEAADELAQEIVQLRERRHAFSSQLTLPTGVHPVTLADRGARVLRNAP